MALDLADVTDSDFIVDKRLTTWINLELAKLYDLLVAADQNYFNTIVSLPVTDSELLPLPEDFARVLKAYWQRPDDRPVPMRRISRQEYHNAWGVAWVGQGHPGYDIEGSNLRIQEVMTGGAVELHYVPRMLPLVLPEDTLNLAIEPSYIDLVGLCVAKRCRIKEESDTSDLRADIQEAQARIISMASDRDIGEPRQISDVYGRGRRSRVFPRGVL